MTVILLRGTEEELMTAWFDLWLTIQRKGAFQSRPHVKIKYSSCLSIFGFIVFIYGKYTQSVMKTKIKLRKHDMRSVFYDHEKGGICDKLAVSWFTCFEDNN